MLENRRGGTSGIVRAGQAGQFLAPLGARLIPEIYLAPHRQRHFVTGLMTRSFWGHPGQNGATARTLPLWVSFCMFVGLVYLRLLYQVSYFPPFFEGEESNAMMMAQGLTDSARAGTPWLAVLSSSASEYNKGYGWALIPFYSVFGYDVRLNFYVVTFYIALICALFFVVFRRVYPRGSWGSYVLVVAFPLFALAVRRYKWHSIDYLAAIAVYIYFLPEIRGGAARRGDWAWKVAAAAVFAVACFFYFGAALYIAPWVALVAWYEGRRNWRRLLGWGSLALVLATATAGFLYQWNGLWRSRVQTVTLEAIQTYRSPALRVRMASVVEYFRYFSSPPYTVLLAVGVGFCLYRIWRGQAFALITFVLLVALLSFEFAIGGVNNADQMNWSMIPLLGILLMGSDAILVPIRDYIKFGRWIIVALVATIFGRELVTFPEVNSHFFLQPYLAKNNTITQSALLLRELMEHPEPNTHYFLPDRTWKDEKGGFDYNVNLRRTEVVPTVFALTFFHDEADLRAKVSAAGNVNCVAFLNGNLSHPPPHDPDSWTLLGRPGVRTLLYHKMFPFGFEVRKFILHGVEERTGISAPLPGAAPKAGS